MQAVDAADYWKPLITPMECEIALVRGRSWTGQYDFDFRPLLATPLPQVFFPFFSFFNLFLPHLYLKVVCM